MNQNGEKRDRKKKNNSVSVAWLIEVYMLHNAFLVDFRDRNGSFLFFFCTRAFKHQDTADAETSENSIYLNVAISFLSKVKKFYLDFK